MAALWKSVRARVKGKVVGVNKTNLKLRKQATYLPQAYWSRRSRTAAIVTVIITVGHYCYCMLLMDRTHFSNKGMQNSLQVRLAFLAKERTHQLRTAAQSTKQRRAGLYNVYNMKEQIWSISRS